MTTLRTPQLITPPREEEEVYPYRRVWRSIVIESGILTFLLLVLFVAFDIVGVVIPESLLTPLNLTLTLLPTLLWLLFSRVPESYAVEPRRRLLTSFTVTALVANAIGVPLLHNVLQPDEWLPLQTNLNRIIGYTTTAAILQEFLKYLVMRYLVWPDYYRVREDSIAYGAAAATAYAMVLNLNYILSNPTATPDAVMIRVYATTTLNLVGSVVIVYGLSETLFANAISFLLPVLIVVAALVNGMSIALRSAFTNATLGLTISTQRTVLGILFSLILYMGPMAAMYFLYHVAERRERDKQSRQAG